MGNRYFIDVQCPRCSYVNEDVYYAPTCCVTEHTCSSCGETINLAAYTGISAEDASNRDEIERIVREREGRG